MAMATDLTLSPAQLLRLIHFACRHIGSQQAAALEWGVSPALLSAVLKGRRAPGGKLLLALGFRREVRYRPCPLPQEHRSAFC
jgi:hypothetical protein